MKFSLMEVFVSGYKYHDGPAIIGDIIAGELSDDKVTLEEEPDNEYDKNAIKILLDDYVLGYISKKENGLVNKWMSQGRIVSAQISEVDDSAPDYQKIKIELFIEF